MRTQDITDGFRVYVDPLYARYKIPTVALQEDGILWPKVVLVLRDPCPFQKLVVAALWIEDSTWIVSIGLISRELSRHLPSSHDVTGAAENLCQATYYHVGVGQDADVKEIANRLIDHDTKVISVC